MAEAVKHLSTTFQKPSVIVIANNNIGNEDSTINYPKLLYNCDLLRTHGRKWTAILPGYPTLERYSIVRMPARRSFACQGQRALSIQGGMKKCGPTEAGVWRMKHSEEA